MPEISYRSNGAVSSGDVQARDTLGLIQEKFVACTTPKELQLLIEEIDRETAKIDHDMRQYKALKLKKHEQEISSLEFKRATKLVSTISNSNELNRIFETANTLGHSLTLKIKSLDQEIESVEKTLEFVQNIQELKTNINKAHYALEHGNLEVTAQCIHNVNSKLSKELINGKFASLVIPSTEIPDLPEAILDKWSRDLTRVFVQRFNEASTARNVEELTKYFQLFPLINQEETGLNCYSRFICDIISNTLKTLVGSTSAISASDLKPGVFSNIAILLFESISNMLSQHETLIKRYYLSSFPEAMAYVIKKIQNEVDSQIGVISDTFYDLRRIDKLFQDIELYTFPFLTRRTEEQGHEQPLEQADRVQEEDVISIVQVGDLINEIAVIFHHWSLYSKFISVRYLQEPKEKPGVLRQRQKSISSKSPSSSTSVLTTNSQELKPSDDELKLPQLIVDSNFTKKINQKLLPAFETLYIFYFRRSLEKSIMIEELPSLDAYLQINQSNSNPLYISPDDHSPCSSVIEDITLILNTTIRNSIQTSILSTVKTYVQETRRILQNDLINGYFIRNLNQNQPRYNQTLSFVSPESNNNTATPTPRSGTPEVNGGMSFFKGASSALGNVVGTSTSTISSSIGGLRTGANNPKLLSFIIHLNTVSVGQTYFTKIINNILKSPNYISSSFPYNGDANKVELWLTNDFLNPFISNTNKIINDSLINLYNQSLKNRIIAMINEMIPDVQETYIVHSNEGGNDDRLIRFGNNWQSLIKPYKHTLDESVFNKLLRLLVINLVNLLEKKLHSVLKKSRINELGSVRLEKDISFFINEVCEDNYQLREKFVRVTQLVLLVDMDDEEYEESTKHANQAGHRKGEDGEEEDDVNAEDEDEFLGINWVLTPQERSQIRSYRV
ncbi:COG4-domain-containing protein [Suhomyces tanzawaensis NRRL Y-17324]|uniref:Conserved oligomeric Golgi complex subunit 4 n=1 Tax=Suhomyces tanzawaensis NRRL Y-17324 TaxID=984487 RepID=A0A1E4SAU5_9ASCO|nr:COG4-domain-containing protein [Suhomyces tanzawaensis NRRL Y-17324]ODV76647.1 COG4-domain-containing protein [Suhomyces tanzawaensis NRRL Y-17324]